MIAADGVVLYWDGTGAAGNGIITGGSGTWNAVNTNWTDAPATTNQAWASGTAIFQTTAGTVTLGAPVSAMALQFAVTGYTITGGTLTMLARIGPLPGLITTNAGVTATIASVVAGTAGVEKAGTGTLVLTGTNTYTGGTTISAGTLSLGSGGTTGSIGGDVVNNGTLVFNRSNAVTFAGVISGTGAVTKLGAGTLTLTGASTYTGITTISAGTLQVGSGATGSIVGDVVNNAALVFNRTGTLTYGGVISGTGTLGKLGAGTVTLTGANTYTGTTTISAGILNIGGSGTTGTLGTGNVVNNATLQLARSDNVTVANNISGTGAIVKQAAGTTTLTGTNTNSGTTTVSADILEIGNGGTTGTLGTGTKSVAAGATLRFNRSGTLTVAGVISGAGNVVQAGTGTTVLTGNSTYTGGTTISAGTLQLGSGGTAGIVAGNITNNAALVFNRSNALTYAGVISGTGTVAKLGAGTTTLTGANTYTGITTVTAGTLQVGSGATGSIVSDVVNNAALVFNRTGTLTYGGVISGTGTLGKLGAGTVTLTGANTYTGTTTISAGILNIGGSGTTGTLGTGNVVNNATLQLARSDNVTVANNISGTGAIVKQAAGTTTLTGTNTNSGTTTVSAGILEIGNGGTTGTLGTGTKSVAAGATLRFNRSGTLTVAGVISGAGNVVQAGTGTTVLTGNSTYTGGTTISAGTLQLGSGGTAGIVAGNITNNAALVFNRSNNLTFAGVVSGTGTLTKDGAGILSLTGASTFTGGTTVSAGTLSIGAGGTTGSIVGDVLNNAALTFNRSNAFTFGGAISGTGTVTKLAAGTTTLTGANTYSGTTTISVGILNIGGGGTTGTLGTGNVVNNAALQLARSNNLTVVGAISGTGTLTKLGAGIATLTGANTYSGATTVSAGTLQIGDGGISGSLGTGNVTLAGGTMLAFNRSNPLTVTNTITGSGTLAQAGPGATTLSGSVTASAVNVTAGTLLVTGTTTAPVSVSTGGTLGGTGTVAGTATIAGGGTLAPGTAGAGTLALNGLTLQSGAILSMDLGAPNVVGGAFNDLVTVNGNLSIGAGIILNVADTGAFSSTPGSYRLVNYSGALTGSAANVALGTLAGVPPNGAVVQTAVSGQVNLIVTSGLATNFWDGPNTTANGVVNGGTGTWNTTSANWTNAGGSFNQSYLPGLTVFTGAAGTATLGANVSANVIQFATTGYTVAGAGAFTLTLLPQSGTLPGLIRTDPGVTATISAPIAGSVGLEKADAGTLILTGTNTYTGGTTISAGTLQIGNGGTSGTLGTGAVASSGTLIVNRSDAVAVPDVITGTGALVQAGAGTTTLTGANTYTGATTISTGTLQIGNGGTSGALGTGAVANSGTLIVNRSDTHTISNTITGTGTLVHAGTGTTTLSGAVAASATTVNAGTLAVTGTLNSPVAVNASATLAGTGSVGGAVVVSAGASIAPGVGGAGVLTVGGLTLAAGSVLDFTLGQPDVLAGPQNDLLTVNGNLAISGTTLNVTDAGAFASLPGAYRLMTYTGSLTGGAGDITLGSLPGVPPNTAVVQTAVTGQVNLITTVTGVPLQFWDGAGAPDDGNVAGGPGAWNAALGNWTGVSGGLNVGWLSGMGVFTGAAGTVTLGEPITAQALQFSTDGYVVDGAGHSINLAPLMGGQSVIRVDAGVSATVAAPLTGTSGLGKEDPGTLVLTSANTYSGGTTIAAGTLQLGSGGSTGSIAGDVVNDGVLAFNRSDISTFAGAITGTGALQQMGPGTTILTGANTYAGGTTIATGTLQIGAGGTTGSIGSGAIIDNGVLAFDRSDVVTLSSAVSGSGSLAHLGTGTLVLTGANSYAGTTSILAGTLQVGDGGTTGVLGAGAVTNAGSLLFNRTDALAVANAISGAGTIIQTGSGATTLSGVVAAGATSVNAGSLFVTGTLTSPTVTVASGALLGGTGSVVGTVTIGAGATIAPGVSPGTLTVGSLVMDAGATADYEFGTPGVIGSGVNDLIVVTGDLALDGTLNVFDIGGFGVGTYRLMDYGGLLTDSGLAFGLMPAGFGYFIDTSTADQINLLVSSIGPAPVLEWNSGTPGVWQAGAVTWIDPATMTSQAWNGQTAAFTQSPGGPITVVGSHAITGLQFDVTGYALVAGAGAAFATTAPTPVTLADGVSASIGVPIGGAGGLDISGNGLLTLTGAHSFTGGTTIDGSTVQIGDCVSAGSISGDVVNNGTLVFSPPGTATFGGAISGTGGVVKNCAGTQTLTGVSTYLGGTLVNAGVLSIASDASLGAQEAALVLNGGALRVTGSTDSSRPVVLLSSGIVEVTSGRTFSVGGTVTGAQALVKEGAGRLVLSGANGYVGGTIINGGVLSISADANLGARSSGVSFDGGVLESTASLTLSRAMTLERGGGTIQPVNGSSLLQLGAIGGPGALTVRGNGLLALTASNTYAGGTTIAGGGLQIGNCGPSGSIIGNVRNDGVLVFSRSDAHAFDGAIDGSGMVVKNCTGTVTLTAANSYSGGTLVNAGTLQGTTTSLQGTILNNAAVVFDQGFDGTLGGALFGSGTVEKKGAGAVALVGDHGLTGVTSVRVGTLALDGTLAGSVAVDAGATFVGSGTIGGTLESEGTVRVLGQLGVVGDVALRSGSTLVTNVSASGSGAALVSNGAVSIDGMRLALETGAEPHARVSSFAVLGGHAGLSGTASVTGGSALVQPYLSQSSNVLFVTLLNMGLPLQPLATSLSGGASGGAIDRVKVGATGELARSTRVLTALPDAELAVALSAIAGEIYPSSVNTAAIDAEGAADVVRSEITARISFEQQDRRPAQSGDALWGGEGRRVWTRVRGDRASYDPGDAVSGRAGAHGGRADLEGLLVGADVRFSDHWLVGIGAGYGQGQLTLDGLAERAEYQAPRLFGYGGYAGGRWAVAAGADIAWVDRDVRRTYAFAPLGPTGQPLFGAIGGEAVSQPSGIAYGGWTEFRFNQGVGAWDVQPTAGLRVASYGYGDWMESGVGALSLTADAQSIHSLRGDAGVRVSRATGRVRPFFSGAYRREFRSTGALLNLRFGSDPLGAFDVGGIALPGDTAIGQAGVSIVPRRLGLSFYYEVQSSSQQLWQSLQLGVRF